MTHFKKEIQQIQNGEKLELTYSFIHDAEYQSLFTLVQELLLYMKKPYIIEAIFMVLKEILVNSNRANAKRIFFKNHNLDLHSAKDYETGIQLFKQAVLENWRSFEDILKNSGLYVKLVIYINEDGWLNFEIYNNSELIDIEKERIQKRIEASDRYNDIISAYKEVADYEESAGLGIVMMILFLRSVGLSKEYLSISSQNGETISTLKVPTIIVPVEISHKIRDQIIEQLKGLPSIPASLKKIIELCESLDSELSDIANEIEKDPAIAIDVLKLANSSSYMTLEPITSIRTAIKLIGTRHLLNILHVINTRRIIKELFPKVQKEWDHANRVSFFTLELSKRIDFKDVETVTIGALLHDIGKIVLLSLEGKLFEFVWRLIRKREIENTKVIEEVSIGISHSELGAMIARKWNVPPVLIAIIEHHQQPYMVEEKFKHHVEIVYLSNMIVNYIDKKIEFYSFDNQILLKYGIPNLESLNSFCDEMEKRYKQSKVTSKTSRNAYGS